MRKISTFVPEFRALHRTHPRYSELKARYSEPSRSGPRYSENLAIASSILAIARTPSVSLLECSQLFTTCAHPIILIQEKSLLIIALGVRVISLRATPSAEPSTLLLFPIQSTVLPHALCTFHT